jgi:hypothetical protein
MSVKSKLFRIPEKLVEDVTRDIKEQNFSSENEYVIKALEHFLKCKDTELIQSMKLIIFRYPAKCLHCGQEIKTGEWAYWGRGVGAICLDCSVQKYGTKGQVRLTIMLKEMKWQKKALEQEIEQLAQKYRSLSFLEILEKQHQTFTTLADLVTKWLTGGYKPPQEERKLFEDIQKALKDNSDAIHTTSEFMKVPLRKKKKSEEITN